MKITTRGRITVAAAFIALATVHVANVITAPVAQPQKVCYAESISKCNTISTRIANR